MKKRNLILWLLGIIPFMASMAEGRSYERVPVEAPFPMDSVTLCSFPDRDFKITKCACRRMVYRTCPFKE